MKLSCRLLDGVGGVNIFEYAPGSLEFSQGDSPTVYIQLVDASKDRPEQGFNPAGRRFVPASGATLQVVMDSLDLAKRVVRSATQPFPGDGSIWSFPVMSTDPIAAGTVDLVLLLVEGVVQTRGTLRAALLVDSQEQS